MIYLLDPVSGVNRSDSQSFLSAASSVKSVSAVGLTNPATVTFTANHNWDDGDMIYFASVGGATWLSTNYYQIVVLSATQVELYTPAGAAIDATALAAWTSGGTATRYALTKTNPTRIHLDDHGYSVGQEIYISSASGFTLLNNTYQTVSVIYGVNGFGVGSFDGTSGGFYTSGGTSEAQWKMVTGATNANPCVITATNHQFTNGQICYFPEGDAGMTQLAGKTFTVANATTNTFELSGIDSSAWGTFTTGAKVSWPRKDANLTHSIYSDIKSGVDEVIIRSAGTVTQLVTSNNTWANNSTSVSTSASLMGTIAAGDYVTRNPSGVHGGFEGLFRVQSRTAAALTLASRYHGTNGVDAASIYHVVPAAYGYSAQNMFNCTIDVPNSGGWVWAGTGDTPAQTGYTVLKHAFGSGNSAQNGAVYSQGSFSNICILEAYRNFYITGNNLTLENASWAYSFIYGADFSGNNITFDNCFGNAPTSGSYPALYYVNTDGHVATDIKLIGFPSASGMCLQTNKAGGIYDHTGITCYSGWQGLNLAGVNQYHYGLTINGCSQAVLGGSAGNNFFCEDFNIVNGGAFGGTTYGANIGTLAIGGLCKGWTFSGSSYPTYGIWVSQSHGIYLEEMDFGSCTYNVACDGYSGDIFLKNNDHGSPVINGINKTSPAGTIYIESDTIDIAARNRAYNIPANNRYTAPEYSIIDSFDGFTGQVFGNFNITRISANPPYYVFQYTSASNFGWIDQPVIVTNVKRGESFTIDFEIARMHSTAFTGTIETVIRLNGVPITSGITGAGNITSISQFDTWDAKSIQVSSGQITKDGVLTIGWKFASGSTATPIAVRINP